MQQETEAKRRFRHVSLLTGRFLRLRFDLVDMGSVERIVSYLEPLTALYAHDIDPGTCLSLDLDMANNADAPCYQLIYRLLAGTPHIQEQNGSIKVQIPAPLIVALEHFIPH